MSNLAPKRGLNLYKFYKDCKIFGLENAVIGLISPLYFSKFTRIVCPQLLWAMLDVPLSRVRTLTQPCLQRLFSPSTSGSYHAPSQMAMTCSGMMSVTSAPTKISPLSLNTLTTSPVAMPFALASFTFISIGSRAHTSA